MRKKLIVKGRQCCHKSKMVTILRFRYEAINLSFLCVNQISLQRKSMHIEIALTHFRFGYEGNCVVLFFSISVMFLCERKVESDWQTIEFEYEKNYLLILLVYNVAE